MTDHAPEAPEAPATVDHLIDALEAGGAKDSEGRFTLDAAVAREKLERFQLEDPTRYVLMLLRAAVRQGATRADFEIDGGGLRLSFDGAPFRPSALKNLWGALLDGEGEAGERSGLVELAVALLAAESLGLERAELRTGDGATGVIMRLAGDAPPEIARLPEGEAPAGTVLRLELGGAGSRVGRAMADYAGSLPEEHHLREGAIYAPLKASLDKQRLPCDPEPDTLLCKIPLDDPGDGTSGAPAFRGVGGIEVGSQAPALLQIVKDGAVVEEHPLDSPAPGFLAVAHGDDLQTDLSQFRVVRDARWKRLLAATKRAQGEALLDLAGSTQGENALPNLDRTWARCVLLQALSRLGSTAQFMAEAADPVDVALASVPLWAATETALTQPGRCSLRALAEHVASGGRVLWFDLPLDKLAAGWDREFAGLQERWVLHLSDSEAWDPLRRLLQERLQSLEEAEPYFFSQIQATPDHPSAAANGRDLPLGARWLVGLTILVAIAAGVSYSVCG